MSKVTDGSYGSLGTPVGADSYVAVQASGPSVKIGTHADLRKYTSQNYIPGGRLTLESGVPVSTTDQTAKTTIYYTPFVHNVINLWDGANWAPTEFTETSLALGTLTASLPYDVFAYLSGGALTLELLAWTSGTARATAVTLQDGRYCKSGDKTRLWLGSFYTASTTTTEDSAQNRYVFNMYNRVHRQFYYDIGGGSHTYASATFREYNGVTTSRVRLLNGIKDQNVLIGAGAYTLISVATANARIGIGFNSTSSIQGQTLWDNASTNNQRAAGAPFTGIPDLGFNFFACLEAASSGTGTFDAARLSGQWAC